MGSVLLYLLKSPTILSVIHDLTDRWLFFGINLDQVLVPILCQPQCFSQGEHANRFGSATAGRAGSIWNGDVIPPFTAPGWLALSLSEFLLLCMQLLICLLPATPVNATEALELVAHEKSEQDVLRSQIPAPTLDGDPFRVQPH